MVNACYYHSERDAVGEATYFDTGKTVEIARRNKEKSDG